MTIHRTDGNQSESRNRRVVGFISYSHRAKMDTKAHAAYQKKLSEEVRWENLEWPPTIWIATTEVIVGQFKKFLRSTDYLFDSELLGWSLWIFAYRQIFDDFG